ncbi:acid-sensing ion channel 4 [Patella vulgata]|uniref:acid-sensing ion channel 4 n=1 Tax=Patella vulgata TaxID=6465 RepID=UPI00217F659B|nr:acid-sensing ion channel 4 [Patella vulgata]
MPKIYVKSSNQQPEDSRENCTRKENDDEYAWPVFTQTTSLHGIKHAFEDSHHILRRIIWLIGVFGMISALLYVISSLVIDYYKYPYTNSLKISVVDRIDYPQVTICNISPFNASYLPKTNEMNNVLINMSALGNLASPINFSAPEYDFANVPLTREFYQQVAFTLPKMIQDCFFEGSYRPCLHVFKPKITDAGVCFSAKSIDNISTNLTGSQLGLRLHLFVDQSNYIPSFQMGAGFKIVLHDPDEEPDFNNNGFLVSPGFTTYASVKKIKYRHLPSPFKAFGTITCLDTKAPSYNHTLKNSEKYDVTSCKKECRLKYLLEKCHCVYYTDYGNDTLCSLRELSTCYNKERDYFNQMSNKLCNCPKPCESTSYEVQLSTAYYPSRVMQNILELAYNVSDWSTNYAEVRIFYENLVETESSQVPVYNLDNILATLGGQMGIFLGASVLTISEFLEYVALKIWRLISRCLWSRPKFSGTK